MMNITLIDNKINGWDPLLSFRLLFYLPNASPFSSAPTCNLLPLSLKPSFFNHHHANLTLHAQNHRAKKPEIFNFFVAELKLARVEWRLKNMMLGKRPRPPMKRTTSMTEITFDLNTAPEDGGATGNRHGGAAGFNGSDQSRILATVSPRNHRTHSVDFAQTSDFLRCCFLCKRRLAPGRDIYMYR